jgi:hypothetical protein
MTLQDLKNIDLGNHATLGIPLKAGLKQFALRPDSEQLEIIVKVWSDGSTLINEMFTFYCQHDLMVNDVTGMVDENGTISEYDFFINLAENPIPIYELIYAKIIEAKNRNRFNI